MPTEAINHAIVNAMTLLLATGHDHEAEAVESLVLSHDALLDACRAAIPYVEGAYECAFPDELENEAVLEQLRAAIAQAQGE